MLNICYIKKSNNDYKFSLGIALYVQSQDNNNMLTQIQFNTSKFFDPGPMYTRFDIWKAPLFRKSKSGTAGILWM